MQHPISESNENITLLERLWVWEKNMTHGLIVYLAVSIDFTLMLTTLMLLKKP